MMNHYFLDNLLYSNSVELLVKVIALEVESNLNICCLNTSINILMSDKVSSKLALPNQNLSIENIEKIYYRKASSSYTDCSFHIFNNQVWVRTVKSSSS